MPKPRTVISFTVLSLKILIIKRTSGVEVFKIIHGDLPELKTRLKFDLDSNHQLKGWLGRMNIRHNYTQQWYLSGLSVMLLPLQRNLLTIEEKMRFTSLVFAS